MTPADLHTWRKDRGLTQEALGTLLGVSRKTINEWERGRSFPQPYLALALKALDKNGKSVDYRNV
jgi:DNA-binding XRE family transcriptional regulator